MPLRRACQKDMQSHKVRGRHFQSSCQILCCHMCEASPAEKLAKKALSATLFPQIVVSLVDSLVAPRQMRNHGHNAVTSKGEPQNSVATSPVFQEPRRAIPPTTRGGYVTPTCLKNLEVKCCHFRFRSASSSAHAVANASESGNSSSDGASISASSTI